ncbi:MAG: IS3 family transposase [Candidatus Methylomirabilaceae bacterium]
MCRVLKVSVSGYYAWRGRSPSARALSDKALLDRICAIHRASRGTYGVPRVHAELKAEGVHCSRKRVARLMRAESLQGVHRRRKHRTTRQQPAATPAPDLVGTSPQPPPIASGWRMSRTCPPTRACCTSPLSSTPSPHGRGLVHGGASQNRARA